MRSETTYQTVLGRLIAQKRKERRIDQEEMARQVGVSRSTWSRIESGSSALNMDQLARAASALGMPLGELMLEVDDIVRELRREGVEVHDSRDQAASSSAERGGAAAVAFPGRRGARRHHRSPDREPERRKVARGRRLTRAWYQPAAAQNRKRVSVPYSSMRSGEAGAFIEFVRSYNQAQQHAPA